jgi:hypothetical protein
MLSERLSTIAYPLPAISRRTLARIDRREDGSAYVQISMTIGTKPPYLFHESTIYQAFYTDVAAVPDLDLIKDALQKWHTELVRTVDRVEKQIADIEPPAAPEGGA